MLKGKCVVLGVCGGIAAYKACELISLLKSNGADVHCMMTKSAQEFITPLTLGTLTGHNVACDMFTPPENYQVEHISFAKMADVFAVVPATANVIGKLAWGIADDFVTTTLMATKAPVVIAPAMNTGMYENPVVSENIERLGKRGYIFADSKEGRLACGDVGKGHLADAEDIFDLIVKAVTKQDLKGKSVLVTAGPTREAIDPVRFITNHSSGKMGYAIAKAAFLRGADVTLISGHVNVTAPKGVNVINVSSALEMEHEVISVCKDMDIIIKSAAVGDFRPKNTANNKIKKDKMGTIELERNPDILKELGQMNLKAKIVGFSMETENLEKNSARKLEEKNAHLIVANKLTDEGAGFGVDTNAVTIFSKSGEKKLPLMSKYNLAHVILDTVLEIC